MEMRIGSNIDTPELFLLVLVDVLEPPPEALLPPLDPEPDPPVEVGLFPDADVTVDGGSKTAVVTGTAAAASSVPLKTLTRSAGESSGGMLAMVWRRKLMRSAADFVASVLESIWTKGVPLVGPPVPKSNL